jgi:hypothetical protein
MRVLLAGWLITTGVTTPRSAHADSAAPTTSNSTTAISATSKIVGLAPASDARKAIAVGPGGEVYLPDGNGSWVRTQPGGTAAEIVSVTAAGDVVIAGARGAPPFKFKDGAWTTVYLMPNARALVGAGSRVLAASGKHVFALDGERPTRLADAPGKVIALAASKQSAVLATDKGLFRLEGITWKPIKKAPAAVRSLASDRWALTDKGALDLTTMKTFPWPAGMRVADVTTSGDALIAIAVAASPRSTQGAAELWTLRAGKLEREPIALPTTPATPGATPATAAASGAAAKSGALTTITGFVVDSRGRVVIAIDDGTLAIREPGERGTWSTTSVRVELAPARPGPAPAASP